MGKDWEEAKSKPQPWRDNKV